MATQDRPSIVFIMADDHASKAISAYGAGINQTPNLDRIAKEGMLFNHCYVTNSTCTPSRAAILTGMHNHVNLVMTLNSEINERLPNVAKSLQSSDYQTGMVGKWHLGEGKGHEPTGFDYWSVVPGQGEYYDPSFIERSGTKRVPETSRDRFSSCAITKHHIGVGNAIQSTSIFIDSVRLPDTFTDDYMNRARAAKIAKMRIADDITYHDLGLVQPDGGSEIDDRKIPKPEDVAQLRLADKDNGTVSTFKTNAELAEFKYQRYMQRYLRTIQSIDDNTGRILDSLDTEGLTDNTIVIYTSDQGFFLGGRGWFDKRFMDIKARSVCDNIICNVDFAPTFLDAAGLRIPTYMQGVSFKKLLQGQTPADWQQTAYHRYWMHNNMIHAAYAHYGIRDQRYKLIYWYNEDFGLEGARPGDAEHKECELFDCQKDAHELFNVYSDEKYQAIAKRMTNLLEDKMAETRDTPVHPTKNRPAGLTLT